MDNISPQSQLSLVKNAFDKHNKSQIKLPKKEEISSEREITKLAREEEGFYENANKKYELKLKFVNLMDLILRVGYRYILFCWVLFIASKYLIFVRDVIGDVADQKIVDVTKKNALSDSVIIALLTSTTATIIGLPALITTSLFPKSKTKKNQTKKITIK